MDRTYVAKRDRLRVGDGDVAGEIHGGEAYPAREVTASLLDLRWVSEGSGTLPEDVNTHGAFSDEELAALGGLRTATPAKTAEPKGKKPRTAKPAK